MFSICVRFVTGRVVAKQFTRPGEVEWPIHPARLFMAFAAAHYETAIDNSANDQTPDDDVYAVEREMLEWLETLSPPSITNPTISARQVVTVFVPVNDRSSDPGHRSKQPRQFPSGYVGEQPARFTWTDDVPDRFRAALNRLLSSVVRVGHSSSLVQCWLDEGASNSGEIQFPDQELANPAGHEHWRPIARVSSGTTSRLRITSPGMLSLLDRAMNLQAVNKYAELALVARDGDSPKIRKSAKNELSESFPNGLPKSQPPYISTTSIYEKIEPKQPSIILRTCFDAILIPLTRMEGAALGLQHTLDVCRMLRNAILTHGGASAPAWLTGHETDGRSTNQPHLAIVPLANVGNYLSAAPNERKIEEYADGHLMGLGLVLPADLDPNLIGDTLGSFLSDAFGEPYPQTLTLGAKGVWVAERETRSRAPKGLTPETWSRPSRFWATVTPIVLDRHPKKDRRKELSAWRNEVAQMVGRSCEHIGLPRPSIVRVEKHAFLKGVPSSQPNRSGFPLMDHSDGKTQRIQTHAFLEFEHPVQGPVLLGAGRFRGYGLCKPIDHKNVV